MNTNPIKTIRNNGQKDGMTNQCLFISILDFIIRNINNTLTLKHLRDVGGLDTSSEHTMCDTINNIYINAINEICDVFELVIIVLPIDYNGNIVCSGSLTIAGPIINSYWRLTNESDIIMLEMLFLNLRQVFMTGLMGNIMTYMVVWVFIYNLVYIL
jgi:hypothetical protein